MVIYESPLQRRRMIAVKLRYLFGIPYLWIVGTMSNGNDIISTALMFGLVYGIIETFSNRNGNNNGKKDF